MTNQKLGLTKTQKHYYEWIEDYIKNHDGQSPTYKEIAAGMGRSVSAAQRVTRELIKRGYLVFGKGLQRSLALKE